MSAGIRASGTRSIRPFANRDAQCVLGFTQLEQLLGTIFHTRAALSGLERRVKRSTTAIAPRACTSGGMKSRYFGVILALVSLGLFSSACSSSSNGTNGTGGGSAAGACTSMCQHLIDDLGMCGNTVDMPGCESECGQHVSDAESTEAEVSCGAGAADCDAWKACGDLL